MPVQAMCSNLTRYSKISNFAVNCTSGSFLSLLNYVTVLALFFPHTLMVLINEHIKNCYGTGLETIP